MTEEKMKTLNKGRKIGAALGAAVFLIFGIMPSIYFGSYGTLYMINHLLGGHMDPGIIVRMIVVVGIMVALFCTASVTIISGSLLGTVSAYGVSLFAAKPAPEKVSAFAKK